MSKKLLIGITAFLLIFSVTACVSAENSKDSTGQESCISASEFVDDTEELTESFESVESSSEIKKPIELEDISDEE